MANGNAFRLFWLTVLLVSCSQTPEPAPKASRMPPPVREDLNAVNETPETVTYWLKWGDLRIPLKRYASPNVYGGALTVELNEFLLAVDQPMQLFQKRRELTFELTSLGRSPFFRRSPWWFSYPSLRRGFLEAAFAAKIREGAARGDAWHLSISVPGEDLRIQSAVIHIRDPFAPYRPEIQVSEKMPDGDTYGFQIINQKGKPPLLRIDTTREETRPVLDLYRENMAYRILHVPDFQTRRRLLTDDSRLFGNRDFYRTDVLKGGDDWLALPEFTGFGPGAVRLRWGQMEADPGSENYQPVFFRQEVGEKPSLIVNGEVLDILEFHLLIDTYMERPRRFVTDGVQATDIQKVLLTLPGGFTVYFDQLIVADAEGKRYLFPVTFAFNVEEEPAYTLELSEKTDGRPVYEETTQPVGWQFKARSVPLPELLANLLGNPPGGVWLENISPVPRVNADFFSERVSPDAGRELLLQKLQDRYRFWLDWREDRPVYYLEQMGQLLERTDESTPNFTGETAITDLIRHLSQEWGVVIINRAGVASGADPLSIPTGTWEEVRQQLASVGLALRREGSPPDLIVFGLGGPE